MELNSDMTANDIDQGTSNDMDLIVPDEESVEVANQDTDNSDETAVVPNLYKRLLKYACQQKTLFFLVLIVTSISSFLSFFIPQIGRYVIDIIIPERQFNLLPWIGFFILAISLLQGVFSFLQIYLGTLFGQKTINSIRTNLYKHIQDLSISFFENRRTGDFMLRLAKDVDTIGNLLSADLVDFLTDSFAFVAAFTYLFISDWQLTLLLSISWPLTIFLFHKFNKTLQDAYQAVQQQATLVSNHLQDTISNINVIKAFGNEQYEAKRFAEYSRNYSEANIGAARLWIIFFPIVVVLSNLGSLIALVFGSWEVMVERISIGELAAFITYVNLLNQPIMHFSRLTEVLQKAVVAAQRIFEILDSEPQVKDKNDAIYLNSVEGRMTFEKMEFAYENAAPVLHNFNLDIQPGMSVALVGSSGAGKSTVAKLAARFYDPTKGRILIDGKDLQEVTLDSLRSHIGIVPQETLLLYGTVRDSIAYGKLDATDEEIVAAAKAANAHEFIMNLPDGYNSIIGERGAKLSGGQRQRIAIARVFLKNPQFVIFDEATSALDTESEQLIQESMNQLLKGRTSLIIAHRLSSIHNVDLIVVLEKGRIVETGTHAELITKKGRYAYLYKIQFPDNI